MVCIKLLNFKGAIPELYDYILGRIKNESYENGLLELIKAMLSVVYQYEIM